MRIETIGNARLYLGDCREVIADNGLRADALVTDPPYGIGFAAEPTKWQRRAGKVGQDWDDAPIESLDFALAVAPVQAVWGGNHYSLPPSRGYLCWFKPDAPPSMGHFELCWTNRDCNTRHFSYSIGATNAERVGHPTQKPVAVMSWCIDQLGAHQTIVDPFMGSGSTGVACAHLSRTFIGIEIKEEYFEMACKRIEAAYAQLRLFA